MKLRDLEKYREIVIQCHDNPDADALASGFGLYHYFNRDGRKVRFVYSGRFPIRKSNLVLMVEKLEIPAEYVTSLEKPELLIMADCQYGTGNVTRFDAETVAVVDHHQREMEGDNLMEIRDHYGSCSTIVWQLLMETGYDVNADVKLATSFYYGLYMDTGQLGDIYHPMDKDMRDSLLIDKSIFSLLKNSNISRQELEVTGEALVHNYFNATLHFSVVQVQACDPNILGLISDFVLQTDVVNSCVVYSVLPDGFKISLRSCDKEIKASDMAVFFTKEIGSGGGHRDKAGGFIQLAAYKKKYGDMPLQKYLQQRMQEYINSYEVIYATERTLDTSNMQSYQKKKIPLGYVELKDIYPVGTPVLVRTLEADLEIFVREDTFMMIGIQGEVYPILKEKFDRSYLRLDEPYVVETEYIPSIHNRFDGTVQKVAKYAHSCISIGETNIYAQKLDSQMKVFTSWDPVNYMFGKVGDYLAVRCDDPHDIYIIENTIFHKTYEEVL